MRWSASIGWVPEFSLPDPETPMARDPDPRYGTKRWQQLRAQVIKRDGGVCAAPHCKSDMSQPGMIHVDHIVEVKDGGSFWDPPNLQTLCRIHHRAKTLDTVAGRGDPVSPNA